eukprot:CAMPEP_0202478412 /NCGR_PEP_ID=MMETSP1360-20130828/94447_1 /ASSEMBLY_ACC=CAM_ASM_000848 /TAXON_ID=515479 /ORGANISM="Licmophora paradoxa, Strain CCMP2313" /LENGTH=429 /DNA_ID=CAMNT_0049105691 /DNA_START=1 /DNA_END=1289 /DNA_ORIENTATION=-
MTPLSESLLSNDLTKGQSMRVDFESKSDVEGMGVDSSGDDDEMLNTSSHGSERRSKTILPMPDLTQSYNQDDDKQVVPADGDDIPITFPQRLMGMLEAETESGEEIITWLPHGKAFIIYQKSRTIASIPDLTPSNSQDDAGKEVVPADGDDVPITFPQRLIGMLEAETESGEEIITWLPHGKAFIIYQKKRFASEVLARHFKQSKFTSFTRKLNRWGFTRMTTGPETGAYYHRLFQRKNPKLCLQMYCQNYGPSQATLNQKLSKSIEKATSSAMPPIKLPPTALMSMSILEIPEYADALAKSKASTSPVDACNQKNIAKAELRGDHGCIATGPDTGAYYHKLFQRKKPKLCLQMYCQNYGPSQAALNQKLSKSIDKATSSVMPPMKLPATALMSMSVLEIPEYADALEKSKASTRPLMLAIRRTLQRLG